MNFMHLVSSMHPTYPLLDVSNNEADVHYTVQKLDGQSKIEDVIA